MAEVFAADWWRPFAAVLPREFGPRWWAPSRWRPKVESLEEVLDRVDAALDEAQDVPLHCHRGDDVTDWACRFQQIKARVDSLACRAAVAVGSTGDPALAGRRRVTTILADRCGAQPRTIAADVRTGLWLDRFPMFGAAFAAGLISRKHLDALRRIDNTRTHLALEAAQEYLLDAAVGCDWHGFIQVLRYWVLGADPDGEEPTEQLMSRFCRLTTGAAN